MILVDADWGREERPWRSTAQWRGHRARPDPIKVRGTDSLAVRVPYSRATSCLRTRPETNHATVVPGSRARRNRRVHRANARDETESRRRRSEERRVGKE